MAHRTTARTDPDSAIASPFPHTQILRTPSTSSRTWNTLGNVWLRPWRLIYLCTEPAVLPESSSIDQQVLPSSKDLTHTRIVSRSGSNFKLSPGAVQRYVEPGKSIRAVGVFSGQNEV